MNQRNIMRALGFVLADQYNALMTGGTNYSEDQIREMKRMCRKIITAFSQVLIRQESRQDQLRRSSADVFRNHIVGLGDPVDPEAEFAHHDLTALTHYMAERLIDDIDWHGVDRDTNEFFRTTGYRRGQRSSGVLTESIEVLQSMTDEGVPIEVRGGKKAMEVLQEILDDNKPPANKPKKRKIHLKNK